MACTGVFSTDLIWGHALNMRVQLLDHLPSAMFMVCWHPQRPSCSDPHGHAWLRLGPQEAYLEPPQRAPPVATR